jgi:hypothetical protein
MRKVLLALLIVLFGIIFVGCVEKEKVESSGIDWYNKIQEKDVSETYLDKTLTIEDADIAENEMNAFLTIVMGLRENIFEFDKDEFNLAFDKYVYYTGEPNYAAVCNEMEIKIVDHDLN